MQKGGVPAQADKALLHLPVGKLSDFEHQYRGQTRTSRALTLTYKNVWVYGHVVKEYATLFFKCTT